MRDEPQRRSENENGRGGRYVQEQTMRDEKKEWALRTFFDSMCFSFQDDVAKAILAEEVPEVIGPDVTEDGRGEIGGVG